MIGENQGSLGEMTHKEGEIRIKIVWFNPGNACQDQSRMYNSRYKRL
jgi:hypothetical protein